MNDLYKEFAIIINNGDEDVARKFLIDHLGEFPREIQEKVAFEVFVDTAISAGKEAKAISDFQKRALEILEILDKEEQSLDDAVRIHSIKESLK